MMHLAVTRLQPCWPGWAALLSLFCLMGPAVAGLPGGLRDGQSVVTLAAGGGIRLIMVDQKGCHYCLKWNREVGGVYSRTSEGRFAPLHRVGRDEKVLKGFAPVVYTPTFILTRNGDEVGRITGYPGEPYFWEELGVLLQATGYVPTNATRG